MDLPPLIRAMRRPSFYPHRPREVVFHQTHISWVLLAGPLAYKVKKPVDFGFLDFTTLPRRRHFCRREVELNRRLAPGIYRGTVPIRRGEDGVFRLAGAGETVEWAVVMGRIPERCLLARGRVTRRMMADLAELLADFHRRSPAGRRWSRLGGPAAVRRNHAEDFTQTERFRDATIPGRDLDAVTGYVDLFFGRHRALLARRVAEGKIRDGHGDLHAEHVAWVGGRPLAIDCIEFNRRFRFADPAADVAFLAMDLERRGAWPLAEAFLEAYLASSGDGEIRVLLDFYLLYRACVRGKVASFVWEDPGEPVHARREARAAARSCFRLAAGYAARDARPLLVVTHGLTGTGKSGVADLLAERLGYGVSRSDLIRRRLLPRTGSAPDGFDRGRYAPAATGEVYRRLLEEGRRELERGRHVVLDATFLQREQREAAQALAASTGARFRLLEAVCPAEEVRERLLRRAARGDSPSEGRWEIYLAQRRRRVPPREVPAAERVRVDTTLPVEEVYQSLLAGLYPLGPLSPPNEGGG